MKKSIKNCGIDEKEWIKMEWKKEKIEGEKREKLRKEKRQKVKEKNRK